MKYTVQPGDSLYQIAQRYGISVEELQSANPQVENPSLLYPGQVLIIPAQSTKKNHSKYYVDEPYPEIRVMGKNQAYASLLLEDYAGRVSETTAIMQYVFHHMHMGNIPGWEEVAEMEEKISIVEMRHLEILGELILLLGGNPRYWDSQQQFWNASFVNYQDFDPCAQLRADIQGEQTAIMNYSTRIQQIQDPYIQAILERIIKDEEHHLKLFTQALTRFCGC